jgi:hypothetical protein
VVVAIERNGHAATRARVRIEMSLHAGLPPEAIEMQPRHQRKPCRDDGGV